MKILSSLQNSHFKRLKKLSNNKFNKKEGDFIIEGVKEISLARSSKKNYFQASICLEVINFESNDFIPNVPFESLCPL